MTEIPGDDFLDGDAYATPDEGGGTAPAPRRTFPAGLKTAGWLVAGLAIGALSVGVIHSSHSNTNNALAGAPAGFNGPAQGAQPPGGFAGGFGGGFSGEQHVDGTIASVSGSTITVTTASGTKSYTIDSSTQLVKDGQQVASLDAMQSGDMVLLHVYPLNGSTHVERVIDGAPAGGQTTTTT